MSALARCLGLATAAAALTGSAVFAVAGPATIRSSLDGKTVLPHRIRWLGYPSLPRNQVKEVDFVVDNRVVWIEHNPPYTYGDDTNWLVTSWLKPGLHRFTARLITKSGARATDTVRARTLAPPQPPAALRGSWHRTVTQAQAGGPELAGTWKLRVDRSGWKITDPKGGLNWIDVAYLGTKRLQARGGIWTSPIKDHGGNGWCIDTNAPVTYAWSVSGSTLTLTLIGSDRCGGQHFIWAGQWIRS
jgi:hypothetical protein